MKTVQKHWLIAGTFLLVFNSLTAQVKIGSNPTTITATTNLETEATDGTKTVIRKDNGYVGIGTNAPSGILHVSGTGGTVSGRLESRAAADRCIFQVYNSASGGYVDLRGYGTSYSETILGNSMSGASSLLAINSGTGPLIMGTYNSGDFVLGTNNAERMRITSAGKLGIGTASPTALLHVSGTSPAVRISDGTEGAAKVLTSDASGNATWQSSAANVVTGSLPATGPTVSANNTYTYTGASITLPAGKWLVNLGATAQISVLNSSDAQYWLGFYLCDATGSFTSTADIISSLSGSGIRGSVGRGIQLASINGVLAINNISGANKTYYVWCFKGIFGGTPTAANWIDVTGNSNLERYFYAIKIN